MKHFFFILTLATLMIGCGDRALTPDTQNEKVRLLPLTVGNWWKYVSEDSPDTSAYLVEKVIDYRQIGAQKYYVITTSKYDVSPFYTRLENTRYLRYEGTRRLEWKNGSDSEDFDESYSVVPTDSIYRQDGYSVIGDNLRVLTPAGDFTSCVVVYENSPTSEHFVTTYVPGVGKVQESWFKGALSLKDYYISKLK